MPNGLGPVFHPIPGTLNHDRQPLYAAITAPRDYGGAVVNEWLKRDGDKAVTSKTVEALRTAGFVLGGGNPMQPAEIDARPGEVYIVLATKQPDGKYHQQELFKGIAQANGLRIDTVDRRFHNDDRNPVLPLAAGATLTADQYQVLEHWKKTVSTAPQVEVPRRYYSEIKPSDPAPRS